jgi:hypothetical protein
MTYKGARRIGACHVPYSGTTIKAWGYITRRLQEEDWTGLADLVFGDPRQQSMIILWVGGCLQLKKLAIDIAKGKLEETIFMKACDITQSLLTRENGNY